MRTTGRDIRRQVEAALASIYGGESPSPRRAKPAGFPLPPLGLTASRLALCARVLPEGALGIRSTTSGGQHLCRVGCRAVRVAPVLQRQAAVQRPAIRHKESGHVAVAF
jgi:hypothetical protein